MYIYIHIYLYNSIRTRYMSISFFMAPQSAPRTWILENFPETQRLFCDIKSLKRDEVLNVVTGRKERVPSADIFITGFVCKSVSSENNERKTYKNCIQDQGESQGQRPKIWSLWIPWNDLLAWGVPTLQEGRGETGETFSGMMDYIKKHAPPVVIWLHQMKSPNLLHGVFARYSLWILWVKRFTEASETDQNSLKAEIWNVLVLPLPKS